MPMTGGAGLEEGRADPASSKAPHRCVQQSKRSTEHLVIVYEGARSRPPRCRVSYADDKAWCSSPGACCLKRRGAEAGPKSSPCCAASRAWPVPNVRAKQDLCEVVPGLSALLYVEISRTSARSGPWWRTARWLSSSCSPASSRSSTAAGRKMLATFALKKPFIMVAKTSRLHGGGSLAELRA